MSGLILPNNAPKTFTIQPVLANNNPVAVPAGTSFSSFTTDPNIATAQSDPATGATTVTPVTPPVTGIVVVTVVGTLPGSGGEISGSIDLHFVDPASTTQSPDRLVVSPA